MDCNEFFAWYFRGILQGWVTLSFRDRNTGAFWHEWFSLSEPNAFISMAECVNRNVHTADVYFSTCPAASRPEDGHLKSHRIAALDVSCIPAFFMDVDTQEDPQKADKDVPKNREIALQKLISLGHPPSLVIDSGHGLQAYWMLESPLLVHDEADRRKASETLRGFAHGVATELGFSGLDLSASELSRILRVPGTVNHKYGKMLPVVIASQGAPGFYDSAVLEACYCTEYREKPSVVLPDAVSGGPVELLSDAECVKRIKRSMKFSLLYEGDTSAYGGDDSRADGALCVRLLEITGGNTVQVDRLFRQSRLYRHEKWDEPGHTREGHTYGQLTLRKALAHFMEHQDTSQFRKVRQDPLINAMTKRLVMDCDITDNGDAAILLPNVHRMGDVTLVIKEYRQVVNEFSRHMSQTTWRLFITILTIYTEHEDQPRLVRLIYKEYAMLCGISDVKHIREQMYVDAAFIGRMTIKYRKRLRGNVRHKTVEIKIFRRVTPIVGGYEFEFGDAFYEMINDKHKRWYMYCPESLWHINSGRYPHSFFFLLKLAEYKRINMTKRDSVPNEGEIPEKVMSVKSLTKASPYFPTLDEVRVKDRHVKRGIFDVFEKSMNALSPTLTWRYYGTGGAELSDIVLSELSYEQFMGLYVMVEWDGYPDCSGFVAGARDKRQARLEGKNGK